MGNSNTSCYDFLKDEKSSYKKPKPVKKCHSQVSTDKVASSAVSDEIFEVDKKLKNNQAAVPAAEFDRVTTSGDKSCTPVRQEASTYPNFVNVNAFDPRSPSKEIERTPIQLNSETITIVDDPRSPTCGIDRTPIAQVDGTTSIGMAKPAACNLNDPRSPTVDFQRTPLNVEFSSDNLRKRVLLTNTLNLKTSPLSKKISFSLDKSSGGASQPTISADDESFYTANDVSSDTESSLSKMDEDPVELPLSPENSSVTTALNNLLEQACNSATAPPAELKNQRDDMRTTFTEKIDSIEPTKISAFESNNALVQTIKSKSDVPILHNHNILSTSVDNLDAIIVSEDINEDEWKHTKSDECANDCPKIEADAAKENEMKTTIGKNTSSIPFRKNADLKSSNSPKPTICNQNDTDQLKVKQAQFKKLSSQSTRSPLSMLGHSNSPEPKRFRPAKESFSTANTMTSQNRRTSNRSRLPRYKSVRSSQN